MIKAWLLKKALGSLTSSTMGVAALMLAGAGWVAANPAVVEQVAPRWGGTVVAAAAFAVAIARARTL